MPVGPTSDRPRQRPRSRPRPKPAVPATPAPRSQGSRAAKGGAVLSRGTFQPSNRKQQAELAQGVRQNAAEQRRQARAVRLHAKAQQLYKQGKHVEALALNGRARQAAGLPALESPGVVGKLIEKTGADLGQAAYYTPGGLYATGKAGVSAARGNPKPLEEIGKQVAKGTLESFEHPGRHPGYTLLNAFALASAGAGAVSRLGAAGEALRSGEGVGAAIARPGFKGGSLLHKKAPGEIALPGGAQALEHDNPLLNVAPVIGKRARIKRVTSAIEQGREFPGPRGVRKHLGAQNVIGRENRAREQVISDIGNAKRAAVAEHLKGLKPHEHTAMRVLNIEGQHALRHPEETIARHVATHERVAAESEARASKVQALLDKRGGFWKQATRDRAKDRIVAEQNNATLNRAISEDIGKALPVLEEKTPRFVQAHAAAQKLTRADEKLLKESGLVSGRSMYESRAAIAKFYGRAKGVAPRGSTYFPTGPQFKFPVKNVRGGPASRVAGKLGLGKPRPGSYLMGTTKHRTGEGSRYGVVERPGEAQVMRAAGVQRLASVDRSYAALEKLATPKPRGEFDIEIRRGGITPELRQRVASEVAHAATGDATALGRLKDLLKPLPGEKARYVDSRYLKEFATSARGLKGAAIVNKPIRFGGVYARPAYIATNRPQNFLMRHLAQGIISKRPLHATVKGIRQELGPEASAVFDALGGETRTMAFEPTRGLGVGQVEQKVINWIQNRTDKNERFLAVLARAHEKGYRSVADLRRLATHDAKGKLLDDQVAIARRARKDMVDFSVTPGERTLSDFIYFYPWMSRGSAWAGRFVAEHPVKSAALASVAPTGEKEQRKALGPVPGWLKGYIPTGKGLVNPASINTFETPAQIGQTFAHPSGPQASSFGEEFGTPLVQAIGTPLNQLPKQLLEKSTAPGLLLERLGLVGKPPKTFPKTGVGPALGPFTLGGLYPRAADEAAIRKQAVAEMNPVERIKVRHSDYGAEILKGAIKTGLLPKGGKLTPQLTKALAIREARYVNREKRGAVGPGTTRKKFAADVRFLEQRKIIPADKADHAVEWAKNEKRDYLVERELRHLSDWYFDDLYGNALADAREKLREKGYDLPKLR